MKRTRMLPVILCVAVVVVAAALVWHQQTAQPVLDPLLAETLSVSDQEQKSLAEVVQTIDQTDSADGLTVTVKQAITYPQMLCLLVELTYPDPIDPATLPEDSSVLPGSYSVTVNEAPIGCPPGTRLKPNPPTPSPSASVSCPTLPSLSRGRPAP